MSAAVISYRRIGTVHSEHIDPTTTPIQPGYALDCRGWIEILPEFEDGLADLDGFSHIYLIYHFHRAGTPRLSVTPFLQDLPRGVSATCAAGVATAVPT